MLDWLSSPFTREAEGVTGLKPVAVPFDAKLASRFAIFSALAYKSNDSLARMHAPRLGYRFETLESNQQRVVIFSKPDEIILAFRGSDFANLEHQAVNFTHNPVPHPLGGLVHRGFYSRSREATLSANQASDLVGQPLADALHTRLLALHAQYPQATIHFTGHSSGAPLAALQAAHLALHNPELTPQVESITGYGSPRYGYLEHFSAFNKFYEGKYKLFAIEGDKVTWLPLRGYGVYYNYINGTPIHYSRLPPYRPSVASIQYEKQRAESSSRVRAMLRPFERHVLERHGMHNYIRAYASPLKLSDKQFYRTLLNNMPQIPMDEGFDLPAFGGHIERHIVHLANIFTHSPLQDALGKETSHELSLLAERLHGALEKELYEQINTVAEVSAVASRLLEHAAKENDDVAELKRYTDDCRSEAAESLQAPSYKAAQLSREIFALPANKELKGFANRIKAELHMNGPATQVFVETIEHVRHLLEPLQADTQYSHLMRLAQETQAGLLSTQR